MFMKRMNLTLNCKGGEGGGGQGEGGGGYIKLKPSMGVVWIFSGATHTVITHFH